METVPRVLVRDFGHDHWSMLALIAAMHFGKNGELRRQSLRINPETHPLLAHRSDWRHTWSTRLRGHATEEPSRVPGHDDIDCIDDLEAAGLIEIVSLANLVVRLTTQGVRVAEALAQWRASGGRCATFVGDAA
jgi:hypothetical protein